jgi:tetratricopeptide (TPR) repeat protein
LGDVSLTALEVGLSEFPYLTIRCWNLPLAIPLRDPHRYPPWHTLPEGSQSGPPELTQASRRLEADGLSQLGFIRAEQGDYDEGRAYYKQALCIYRELGDRGEAMVCLAGLAHISLTQGNLAAAQDHVEEILSYLETGSLGFMLGPFRVCLTSYRVLRANGDPRADDVLQRAHALLQERAAKISDEEERRSYLENVAAHREIVEEYAGREHAGGE